MQKKIWALLLSVLMVFGTFIWAQPSVKVNAEETFTVIFHIGPDNIPNQQIPAGGKVTRPPDPISEAQKNHEYEALVFDGWYKDKTYSPDKLWDFGKDTVTANITLYGRWQKGFRLDFDLKGHGNTPTPPSQYVIDQRYAKEPTPAPTDDHYTFAGWTTVKGKPWDFNTQKVVDNGTLFAKWVSTVTFNMNGHGDQVAEQQVKIGDKIVKPEEPKADQFKFEGWFKDAELKEAWDFDNGIPEGNVTLYAKWVEDAAPDTSDNEASEVETVSEGPGYYQPLWRQPHDNNVEIQENNAPVDAPVAVEPEQETQPTSKLPATGEGLSYWPLLSAAFALLLVMARKQLN